MNTTDKIMALADALSDADFELARINSYGGDTIKAVSAAKAAQDKLRAAIEALVRDAERYRWLRDEAWGGNNRSGPHLVVYRPGLMPSAVTELAEDAADTAIDAAMQEKQS